MKSRYFVFIALCLILGSFLRFHNIGKYGLIGDEMYAALVANFVAQEGAEQEKAFRKIDSPYFTNIETGKDKSFSNFLTAVARRDNGSAALHSFALHYWIKIFDNSDASMRGFSAFSNILLCIFLFYFVLRHLKSRNLALLSVFLSSISPFYISFSNVARSYSLVFTMALLATHLLLLTLEKKKFSQVHVWYGVVAFLLLMTHYSAFIILVFHAIFVLLYYRKLQTIIHLAIVALIPIIGMIIWLNTPGGQWAFHSIEQSKVVYLEEARNSKDAFLQLSSFKTILPQLAKTTAMSILPIEVVYDYISGLKNWGFTLLHAFLTIVIIRFTSKTWEKLLSIMLLTITLSFLVSHNYLAFIEVSFALVLIIDFFLNQQWKLISKRKALLWIFPLSLLFLGIFAVMDGNTFRIIPRYSGYGYAFGIVLWAAVLLRSWISNSLIVKTILSVQSIFFLYFWGMSIASFYQDDPIRYFHNLSEQRMENPYALIAEKIEATYAEGDTVIYPSLKFYSTDPGYDMPEYSVQDAQYVNLYLRATKPEIIQRVDTTESDKVFLKNASGEKELLFDFENGRFRY